MHKQEGADEAIVIANFDSKMAKYMFPAEGCFKKILDSADLSWAGPGAILPDFASVNDRQEIGGCTLAVYLKAGGETVG
jgi:hypothetical protein